MERYTIVSWLSKDVYQDGAPVIIKSGALVWDEREEKHHVQLKFQNLTEEVIATLKAKIYLCDESKMPLGEIEYTYVDQVANKRAMFGAQIPIPIGTIDAKKIRAAVLEVSFFNGESWIATESSWQEVPEKKIDKQFDDDYIKEFRRRRCWRAIDVPKEYSDVWRCACGEINKKEDERCCFCGSSLSKMLSTTEEQLREETEAYAEELERKVYIEELLNNYRWNFEGVVEEESEQKKKVRAKKEKKEINAKKRRIAVGISIFLVTIIFSCVLTTIFYGIYGRVVCGGIVYDLTVSGHATVIDRNSTDEEEIVIPTSIKYRGETYSVTKIGKNAFQGDKNIRKLVIPETVVWIGKNAFFECDNLVKIEILGTAKWYRTTSCADWRVCQGGELEKFFFPTINYAIYLKTALARYYWYR